MRFFPAFIMAILMALSACKSDTDIMNVLTTANSVLDSLPDSALSILNNLDGLDLETKEAKARYSLLRTVAMLKTGNEFLTDSILQPAVDYFGKTNKPSREAMLTHYAKAALSDEPINKLREFDKTIELASGVNKDRYRALSYFNKACEYHKSYSFPDEMECINKGMDLILTTTDTAAIVYGYFMSALAHIGNEDINKAKGEIQSGMDLIEKSGITDELPYLQREKAYIHFVQKDYSKSIQLYQHVYDTFPEVLSAFDYYTWANSHAYEGNLKDAVALLHMIDGLDIDKDKGEWLYSNAIIKYVEKDYQGAFNLLDSMISYNNEVVKAMLNGNLSRQEKNIAQLEATYQRELAEKRKSGILIGGVCTIAVVGLLLASIYIIVLRNRHREREHQLMIEQMKAKAKIETDALMMKIEQLDASHKFTNDTLTTMLINMQNIELQNDTLKATVDELENKSSALEKEIDSKEQQRRMLEYETCAYAQTIESLKLQLEINRHIIEKIRKQAREDLLMSHYNVAAFCNAMPKGITSKASIKVYEVQRDLKLSQYKDSKTLDKLQTQIDDLTDNMISHIKTAGNLTEADVKTLIYDICGFNYKTIADLIGASPSAVATRRSRIKEKLSALSPGQMEQYSRYISLLRQ